MMSPDPNVSLDTVPDRDSFAEGFSPVPGPDGKPIEPSGSALEGMSQMLRSVSGKVETPQSVGYLPAKTKPALPRQTAPLRRPARHVHEPEVSQVTVALDNLVQELQPLNPENDGFGTKSVSLVAEGFKIIDSSLILLKQEMAPIAKTCKESERLVAAQEAQLASISRSVTELKATVATQMGLMARNLQDLKTEVNLSVQQSQILVKYILDSQKKHVLARGLEDASNSARAAGTPNSTRAAPSIAGSEDLPPGDEEIRDPDVLDFSIKDLTDLEANAMKNTSLGTGDTVPVGFLAPVAPTSSTPSSSARFYGQTFTD